MGGSGDNLLDYLLFVVLTNRRGKESGSKLVIPMLFLVQTFNALTNLCLK